MDYDVKLEFGVKQVMRDGVRLSSDIYRPNASGRFPVILTRSPYMTVEGFQKRFSEDARFFATNGYVFVVQDCRGKNDSEGIFRPFFDDHTDGFDTLDWCAKQEWSNGEVGTIGGSYQAWNQWAAATQRHPNLRAMVCVVALPDPVFNVPFQNGALVLWMAEWMAMVDGKRNTDPTIYDSMKLYNHLPLRTMDERFGRKDSSIWQEWIDHPSADEYWKRTFYQDKFNKIDVPVLHVSGWYDDDVIGTHVNYTSMKKFARSQEARENQKLIIGPWPHHVNLTRQLGGVDFGQSSLIDLRRIELDWFNYWLKHLENGIMQRPKVEIFTLGTNAWRQSDSWPLEGTQYTPYFLRSQGKANTTFGDGQLSVATAGKDESFDSYSYDPSNPCPNIFDQSQPPAEGPFDQRPIERRDDVLVYSTPALDSELDVTGPVTVKLFASTSAADTDFWAQLTDVYPSGYSMHLTEGIIRGRYRKSLEKPELLEPTVVYEFDIDLWITSNVFQRGHKVRLDISSSSFPKYDRNPNTGNKFGTDTELKVAQQKIYHTAEHASYILLPIVKGRETD
jgi:hypothetical protein